MLKDSCSLFSTPNVLRDLGASGRDATLSPLAHSIAYNMFKLPIIILAVSVGISGCASLPEYSHSYTSYRPIHSRSYRSYRPIVQPTQHRANERSRTETIAATNPNAVLRPEENWTVLHQAANEQNFPLVRSLVANGADTRARARWKYLAGGFGPYDQTPARVALRWGRTDIAKYLASQSGENYELIAEDARKMAAKGRAAAIKDTRDTLENAIELDRRTSY